LEGVSTLVVSTRLLYSSSPKFRNCNAQIVHMDLDFSDYASTQELAQPECSTWFVTA